MLDAAMTKDQLLAELGALRERVFQLEREKKETALALKRYRHAEEGPSDSEAGYRDEKAPIALDISGRAEREEALRKSEEKHRHIIEHSTEGIFQMSPDGRLLSANPAFAAMFGFESARQIVGEGNDFCEKLCVDPQDRSKLLELVNGGKSFPGFEMKMRRRNGDVFLMSLNVGCIRDSHGDLLHCDGFATDITDRKRAEEALREAEMEMRRQSAMIGSLLDSIPDFIFYKDLNGVYLGCNHPFAELVGRPRDQIVGKTDYDLVERKKADFYREHDKRMLESSAPRQNEEWIAYPDGREKLVETLKTPLRGPDGAPIGILGISRDITERKRMEQQQQQLLKAESLTRMAGAIAHHFNNQLAVVMGGLEMAREDLGADHSIAALLTESCQAAGKAADISTRMLACLGQTSAELTALDLVQTCNRAIDRQVASFPQSIRIESSMPSEPIAIRGHGPKVEQVLSNLIANAQEAISDDKGTIRISVRVVSAREARATHLFPAGWTPQSDLYGCLEVCDTGCGIAVEQIDSIFDPFFSTKFTGRGLGLAEVQGIVRMHGGAVSVESAPGLGSVFSVFWPLAPIEAASLPKRAPRSAPPGEGAGFVLVVDDDCALRNLAAKMLGRLGRRVLTAAGGLEAIEVLRARESETRLVLLDLTMPGMNGWETLAGLRALRPDIAVILASGYDKAQAMEGSHTEFPQTFLHKPYGMMELKQAIDKVLGAPIPD
ncbi:MAG: PAS domain S-box protein [Syntrophobacteraceae bacterium]|nr:PAS domain S-box protein [Syntrophobacteraceae bacterium]